MRITLAAAALYNLVWGTWVVVAPEAIFRWVGITPPLYPQIWQCVGMIVAVFGVGYAIAALAPLRHWPIVVVGLLGKTLGPIGFLQAATGGDLPWSFGVTIVTNDLIWVVPFALILRATYSQWRLELGRRIYEEATEALLETVQTNTGQTVVDLSHQAPVLMAFLRHTGCTFCREATADLAREKATLDALGVQLALVYMGDDPEGERFFASYGLKDTPRISDPQRTLYRAFKLRRGALGQLFGIRVWLRAIAAAFRGHYPGLLHGDGFQMPGLFLIRNGRILRAFRYKSAADRPDYAEFVCGLSDASDDKQTAVRSHSNETADG
jgi:peroxiredoxin